MFTYACPNCKHSEEQETKNLTVNFCPVCKASGKFKSMERLEPGQLLSGMGTCSRCGKFASRGETINGKYYGPECKKKVSKE